MKNKHTPGPRFASANSINGGDGAKVHIAHIYDENNLTDYDGERDVTLVPAEANARLIAAAPELLEALQALTKIVNQIGNTGMKSEYLAAQRAIAKALGKEKY